MRENPVHKQPRQPMTQMQNSIDADNNITSFGIDMTSNAALNRLAARDASDKQASLSAIIENFTQTRMRQRASLAHFNFLWVRDTLKGEGGREAVATAHPRRFPHP